MPHRPSLRRRQRGSILIFAALGMSLAVILLSITDMGLLFYYKREFQKSADLSALAGARLLSSSCAAAISAATDNANQNLGTRMHNTPSAQCGTWSARPTPSFTANNVSPNALQVTISGTAPKVLPFTASRTVSASAIASLGSPIAVFSVGSTVVRVNGDSILGSALKGIGLDLSGTSLIGYDGLANATITPSGLLQALGIPVSGNLTVGDLNALLAANNVSVSSLLNAVVTLAGHSELLSTNATLVSALTAKLGLASLPSIALGTSGSTSGIFAAITSPNAETGSALNANVNALSLIEAALGVAANGHAISISALNINLLLATVTAQASIIEPPSIGIGGIGATAFTAQVRTYLRIQTTNALLGALLSSLISLDLPIVIDVAASTGTITNLCTTALQDSSGNDRAQIAVTSSLLKLCAGAVDTSTLFSTSTSCDNNVQNKQMLNLLGLLVFNGKIVLNALPSSGSVTLKAGDTQTVGNSLALGTTVSNLVSQLLGLLLGGVPSSSTPTSAQTSALANQLWNNTSSLCTANTTTCHTTRLNSVTSSIQSYSSSGGLLSGLIQGLGDLLNAVLGLLVGNGCTSGYGLLGLGPTADSYCISMIQTDLANSSTAASGGGAVANAVSVVAGILAPTLNAIGGSLLSPLLQNVLGLNLGLTDVTLMSLTCNPEPRLVN